MDSRLAFNRRNTINTINAVVLSTPYSDISTSHCTRIVVRVHITSTNRSKTTGAWKKYHLRFIITVWMTRERGGGDVANPCFGRGPMRCVVRRGPRRSCCATCSRHAIFREARARVINSERFSPPLPPLATRGRTRGADSRRTLVRARPFVCVRSESNGFRFRGLITTPSVEDTRARRFTCSR